MGNTKILRRILAGVLAVMLGLSALGGIVMAFAITSEAEEDMPYAINDGQEYIPADEDWEHISLDTTGDVTICLEDKATLVLPEGITDYLWLGWSYQDNSRTTQLAEQHGVLLDVVDFTFVSTLDKPITMQLYSKNPYLYRINTRGDLVAVQSEYADGVHTFTTDILDTFVASTDSLAL